MSVKHYYASITGMTGIKSIDARDNISSCAASVKINCTGYTCNIGDLVNIDFGYTDDHTVFMTGGIVKGIDIRKPEFDYVISVYDKLVLTQDNFIAPVDPDNPMQYISTAPETIVRDMLTNSGITSTYYGTATGFLSGLPDNPLQIELVTAWQMIESFNKIVAYMTWCTPSGDIYFNPRKPYIVGGDTAAYALAVGGSGNILRVERDMSDDLIRNKVVVYGKSGTHVKSVASASSPYLPAGFYKTLGLVNDIVDRQDMADATASYNLTMFNRLTDTMKVTVVGKPWMRCRDIVSVTEPFTGQSGDLWFVASTQHNWSKAGYTTELTLVR